ncbi:1-acyl-sn-glycerol-3-phosphate acyltransferase [Candidatus Pacearchaeota archaeon]|nr:1-acyl-sn-glycerol-3-phosphate acyltransferase [Candidatus Pacearchaeota archaeon]
MSYLKDAKEELRRDFRGIWTDLGVFSLKLMALPYKCRVYGKENIPKSGAILAANHSSYMDPIFMVSGLNRRIYFFVKHYIAPTADFEHSTYGRLLASVGQILLKDGEIDINSIKKAKRILKSDSRNNKLGIFSEGTRTYDGKFGKIQEGTAWLSYITHSPIIPIGIKGTYDLWPRHRKLPRLSGKVRINVGKPLYPDYGIEKRKAIKDLTEILQNEIERLIES